jgi:N-acetylmuramoyl-L-alanine amidase
MWPWWVAAWAAAPWPTSSDALVAVPLPADGPRRPVVLLSAGHAAGATNRGNTGVHGQLEEETNLAAANDLAARLRALDRFDVVLAREGAERPSYDERIQRATAAGADLLLELHTDVRGELVPWAVGREGQTIYRVDNDPGFSVLYNDHAARADEREAVAVALAESLSAAGFPAYLGADYVGLYEGHTTPGVYRDRRGLKMLRGPPMPSVIVETHSAVDFDESLRFREARTQEVFAAAVAAALSRALDPVGP